MAKKPMKTVTITPALNGWVVGIGCATVVALSKTAMLDEIGRYIDDPGAVEKEYVESAVNQGTYVPDVDEVPPEEVSSGRAAELRPASNRSQRA